MSYSPPIRPEWVVAINAGRVAPIAAEAALPLDRDDLLAEARAHQGLPDGGIEDFCCAEFDADRFVEPLDHVLAALETEAELNVMGRWMTRRFLLRLLEVRLQLMATLRADPGVREEPIETPLFVAGAPRTGTTILHAILAADPDIGSVRSMFVPQHPAIVVTCRFPLFNTIPIKSPVEKPVVSATSILVELGGAFAVSVVSAGSSGVSGAMLAAKNSVIL